MKQNGKRILCLFLVLALMLGMTPAVFAAESDAGRILNDAYALQPGAALEYDATLTGEIIKVDTPYSSAYKNITVTIQVPGYPDKPVMCYRMKGEGANTLAIGDTVTVTGVIMNYNGIIEFMSGCSLDQVVKGDNETAVAPSDPREIVDAALALDEGTSLPYMATLTGQITQIVTAYSEAYKNITVNIEVAGTTGNEILRCYRMRGEGADTLAIGDTITVSGEIRNFIGMIEFKSGCTLDEVVKGWRPDPEDICIIAGSAELCGSVWDPVDSNNAMTLKGDVYEKVYENVAAGDYQFKVVHNGNWIGIDGNNVWISLTAPCDVTITYNPADGGITYTGDNVGEYTFQVSSIYVVGEASLTTPVWLNGENWNPAAESNRMTEMDAGVYTITYYNIPAGTYEFKFAADGNWNHSWGNLFTGFNTYADILYNGCNITFELSETKDVTLTLDLSAFSLEAGGAKYKIALSDSGNAGDSDMGKILNDAYALEPNTQLNYDATLTGRIIKVDTPYDSNYRNITVTIEVSGYPDKPVRCYRMKGEGTDALAVGDIITVTGRLCNYNGTVEFGAGCTLDDVFGCGPMPQPPSSEEIVDAAFALEKGECLPYHVSLTGKITGIVTPYDDMYCNITVNIEVNGSDGRKTITCYRLKGEGAAYLQVGDNITVTGQLMRYYKAATEDREEIDRIEFCQGSTFYANTELYCQTPDSWTSCYVYWWGSSDWNPEWPGVSMTLGVNGIWSYTVPVDATNVIFSNGSGGQSMDLERPYDHNIMFVFEAAAWYPYTGEKLEIEQRETYYVAGDATLCGSGWNPADVANAMIEEGNGIWYKTYYDVQPGTYNLRVTNGSWDKTWSDDVFGVDNGNIDYMLYVHETAMVTVTFDSVNEIVMVDVISMGSNWLYCLAPDWTSCYVYWWGSVEETYWPGVAMTMMDDGVWGSIVPIDATNVLFHNGSDVQTPDLIRPPFEDLYDYELGIWYGQEPEPEAWYFVAGDAALCGSDWDPADFSNMMEGSSCTGFRKTYYNVQPGIYHFVVTDGTWNNVWPNDRLDTGSYVLEITAPSDVTVYFHDIIQSMSVEVTPASGGETSDMRVVGNANWMGNWDPANSVGIMQEVQPGVYRKAFENVQPGSYELKITQNGTWDKSWGDNGNNFCFTVAEICTVTITFTLVGNDGTIRAEGTGVVEGNCQHDYVSTVVPATCDQGSYEALVCSLCGDIDLDSVSEVLTPPLGHSYETVVMAPTCTEEGYTLHICSRCGDGYEGGTTPALGHRFSDYVSDGNATCTADGTQTSTCRLCGMEKTETEEGSALGHSFTNYLDDCNALCWRDGTKTAKCDRCHETDTVTVPGSAVPHVYIDGICVTCGEEESSRLLGDITGDNKLNIGDVARLYAMIRGGDLVVDEVLLTYADITGDGKLNIGDAARLYAHIREL